MSRLKNNIYLFVILFSVGCNKEDGCFVESGKIVTEEIETGNFHSIESNIRANFNFFESESPQVLVTGDKNIVRQIKKGIVFESGILKLQFSSCVGDYNDLTFDIHCPELKSFSNKGVGEFASDGAINVNSKLFVDVSGTGDVVIAFEENDSVFIALSGNSNIEVSGNTIHSNIDISGNGTVSCFELYASTASVKIVGNGQCMLRASDYLNAKINGNGNIYFKGYPQIDSLINGNGNIIDAN